MSDMNTSGNGQSSANVDLTVTQQILTNIKAKTDNIDVLLSTRTKPTDTQKISATALPLPNGAATETTLNALNNKIPAKGQKGSNNSVPVVVANDQVLTVYQSDVARDQTVQNVLKQLKEEHLTVCLEIKDRGDFEIIASPGDNLKLIIKSIDITFPSNKGITMLRFSDSDLKKMFSLVGPCAFQGVYSFNLETNRAFVVSCESLPESSVFINIDYVIRPNKE